jgi:hypothetical protein
MRKFCNEPGKPTLAALLFILGTTDAIAAPPCDLSPLVLPEKAIPANFGNRTISARVQVRFDFDGPQNNLYAIREITLARVPAAQTQIGRVIEDEVGALPFDDCGTQVRLGKPDISTSSGELIVLAPVHAEQWGCFVGIKALGAAGTFTFRVSFLPQIAQPKFIIAVKATHSGELTSTIPDIDPSLTETIQNNLQQATSDLVLAVEKVANNIQAKLDSIQADLDAASEEFKGLYHPMVKSVGFSLEGRTLTLMQERQTELRPGTTCSLRRIAKEKWNSI